ncbi:hypothetical protein DPMN_130980 [Dreissena polymorpha]|uniref:Uncharacterized protein n=1 Tax=Dreissena polymorpha TaxID=45954 RepID=A0A9D4HC01_DREPO|nr:hypothetical protein DPMN_130980 [Dreissena polymorpha]
MIILNTLRSFSSPTEISVLHESTWTGDIRCPSDCGSNASVTLRIVSVGEDGVTGIASLGRTGNGVHVAGSYSSYTKHLILQVSLSVSMITPRFLD